MYIKFSFILVAYVFVTDVHSNIIYQIKYFEEIIAPDNLTVREKRDAPGNIKIKLVSFSALRRNFTLTLIPGSPVLHPNFKVNVVDGNDKMMPFRVDLENVFSGYLNGNPEHGVDAVNMNGVWLAQIYAPEAVYHVEPLRHHNRMGSASSMIVFRNTDIEDVSNYSTTGEGGKEMHPFCKEVQFGADLNLRPELHQELNHSNVEELSQKRLRFQSDLRKRYKVGQRIRKPYVNAIHGRTTSTTSGHEAPEHPEHSNARNKRSLLNTCDVLVLADYEVYKGLGDKSVAKVTSLLINVYQGVDRKLRATKFGRFYGVGISVKEVSVYSDYSKDEELKFNAKQTDDTGMKTLRAMTRPKRFRDFCIVHLTTQRILRGTLGLAATAESTAGSWNNGICAGTQNEMRNIGLSTTMNALGNTLPMSNYVLVVTHELGHNFGSRHDPQKNSACSPPSRMGGKYIMWPFAGNARDTNSLHFSPCSREEIGKVLENKAHHCLKPKEAQSRCGNGIADSAEDCDSLDIKNDRCCTTNCRFRQGALCSPHNHPCCTENCGIAPPTQKCFKENKHLCQQVAFCSGNDAWTCPIPSPSPNNAACENNGKCWYGQCLSFCQVMGLSYHPPRQLLDCSCEENRYAMCQHCCRDAKGQGHCQIMGGAQSDGIPCLHGYCMQGDCVESSVPYDELTNAQALREEDSNGSDSIISPRFLYLLLLVTGILF